MPMNGSSYYSSFPLVLYHTRSLSIFPLKFSIFIGKLLKVVDRLVYYNAKKQKVRRVERHDR